MAYDILTTKAVTDENRKEILGLEIFTQPNIRLLSVRPTLFVTNGVFQRILSRVLVIIDGVCIGEWIYWLLVYTTRNYK
jgi:hypothetical protein